MPNVWLGLGLTIHIFSCIVFRLRLRGWRLKKPNGGTDVDDVGVNAVDAVSDDQGNDETAGDKKAFAVLRVARYVHNWVKPFLDWFKNIGPRARDILTLTEFVPCAAGGYVVHIRTFTETKTFLFLAWWQSILTILHVVFGTLVFAGMLFVGLQDAMSIVGRYIIPVVVCRVILMYELAGVRESWATLEGVPVTKFDEAPQGNEGEKGEGLKNGAGVSVRTW